jgi:hypothetical protein
MDVSVHKAPAESLKELTAADKMLLTCNQDSMWDVVDGLGQALQLADKANKFDQYEVTIIRLSILSNC